MDDYIIDFHSNQQSCTDSNSSQSCEINSEIGKLRNKGNKNDSATDFDSSESSEDANIDHEKVVFDTMLDFYDRNFKNYEVFALDDCINQSIWNI